MGQGCKGGGFRNSWRAGHSLRRNPLLQGSSYFNFTLCLLLQCRVSGGFYYCKSSPWPPNTPPPIRFSRKSNSCFKRVLGGRSRSSKDVSGLPKIPQNSVEPLGFCRKVLRNVSHSRKLVEERFCIVKSLLKKGSAEP